MMRSTKYLIIAGEGMGHERFERLDKAAAMRVVKEIQADGQKATLCKIVSEVVGVFEPKAVKP